MKGAAMMRMRERIVLKKREKDSFIGDYYYFVMTRK